MTDKKYSAYVRDDQRIDGTWAPCLEIYQGDSSTPCHEEYLDSWPSVGQVKKMVKRLVGVEIGVKQIKIYR